MFWLDDGILQKKIVDPSIYGEFLRILSSKPAQLSGWFEGLFESFQDGKYYHRDQVYALMISLLTAAYRQYPLLYGVCPQIISEEQIPVRISQKAVLYHDIAAAHNVHTV